MPALLRQHLTDRDLELLDTLTQRVRVLSLDQVARTWWGNSADPRDGARRRLRSLEGWGFIERVKLTGHRELELTEPLVLWSPGDEQPDFGALAYRLERRWPDPPATAPAAIASREAGSWLGGKGGRVPKPVEVSHDLSLGALYLRFRSEESERARHWVSEARLKEEGFGDTEVLPDALIRGGGEETVIEFAGSYPRSKFEKLHTFCARRGLPYEVW